MLLIDARRPGADGRGRASWSRSPSRTGRSGIGRSSPRGSPCSTGPSSQGAVGEYQLQAAIAAVHDRAATADDTDWPQILALYGLLERMTGNPVVTLNRAVAAAMADGPGRGPGPARRRRRAAGGALPPRRRSRAPARAGRRHGGRAGALPRRGRPDDEPAGAALPGGAGRAPQPGLRNHLSVYAAPVCGATVPRAARIGASFRNPQTAA